MSLYWLRPEWTQTCCANCGTQIWPEGDPDWGLCWPCMSEQTEAQQQKEDHGKGT